MPHGTSTQNNEVPYGSIIDCGPDGMCRVFDQAGVQFLAVYDSNEAHMMEVPNGAMIDSGSVGNVSVISLNGSVILTKINEVSDGELIFFRNWQIHHAPRQSGLFTPSGSRHIRSTKSPCHTPAVHSSPSTPHVPAAKKVQSS